MNANAKRTSDRRGRALLFLVWVATVSGSLRGFGQGAPVNPADLPLPEQPAYPTRITYEDRAGWAPEPETEPPARAAKGDWEFVPPRARSRRRWSVAFGVGVIGDTTVKDYFDFNFPTLEGDGAGYTYNLTVTYRIHEFNWRIGRVRLRPELEAPFMLTLVDDKVQGIIPDYNLGVALRWRDCPWNRYIYTTFSVGAGISYSSKVWTADRQRHPGEDRSRWKFWLPIEVTLALPRFPQYQLTAFIDHQSGGRIFDYGGVDAFGFGFRYLF